MLLSSFRLSTEKASTLTSLLFQAFFHAVAALLSFRYIQVSDCIQEEPKGHMTSRHATRVKGRKRCLFCAVLCAVFIRAARQILFATARHWVVDCPSARAFERFQSFDRNNSDICCFMLFLLGFEEWCAGQQI